MMTANSKGKTSEESRINSPFFSWHFRVQVIEHRSNSFIDEVSPPTEYSSIVIPTNITKQRPV